MTRSEAADTTSGQAATCVDCHDFACTGNGCDCYCHKGEAEPRRMFATRVCPADDLQCVHFGSHDEAKGCDTHGCKPVESTPTETKPTEAKNG